MSPQTRLRNRISIVLNMVMAFVIMILLAQLWLFTVALEVIQPPEGSPSIVVAILLCSAIGCGAVWALIRFFLKTEKNQ